VANAGTVTVDFAAEVAKFNASLKQVNDRVKSVESGFKSLEKVASTALKFFSVGIATSFIKSAAEAADALGKTADKLGLSTERLAAFQLAAADAGVETGTLNKLLTDAQRRLGEAAQGTGATYDALRSLGLGVRELQQLSPDELFLRYADSINQLKSRAEQFSVAQDLFGKSAQEAFTFIAAGRPAIDEAAATVERLGLALSRVDIFKIEQANDKLGLLAKTSQAFGQQVAAALAPFVTEFVDRLTGVGVAADDTRSKLDVFARSAFISFEIASNAAKTFDAVVSGVVFTIAKANEVVFGLIRKGEEFTARLDESLGLDTLAQSFREDAAAMGTAEDFFAAISERSAERIKNAADSIKSFAQIFEEADQIVARSQARAEEAAARQTELNTGLTGESRFESLQFEFDSELVLREQHAEFLRQFLFEQQEITNAGLESIELEHLRNVNLEKERLTQETEARILAMKQSTTNAAIGLLSALAGRSKVAALALIAFEKIRAIAQVKINTAVAVMNAMANVPYPANLAAAAHVASLGTIQIGLIAATGIAEAANVFSSSSAGAPIGSPQNPVFTDTGGRNDEQTFGAQQKNQISIRFEGVFTAAAAREIAEQIRDVVENSDVHIIGPNSSNGRELRGE
jgi:hypothetical protein